ncbi:hypothetical protein [[Clostridium] aminophilum]|uniref:Glycosyl transferase family 2 n=1 Tax=[Clostridium] aminophilum TaxID=1526 RepID=A0A1I6IUZ2_9FIRM|nr:hypothetical protein [[Clostridium] aminophilum]SFR70556.1 hypothetical protein SAMN02910262_00898 [[Clostridium] aminophilum]
MKIALSLIVKNEQRSLLRCLLAAAPLVDLIVIADTGSTDRTKEIIEEFRRHFDDNDAPLPESHSKSLSESPSESPSETHGPNRPPVQVYDFPWCNDFSAARNFTLERAEELGADIHFVLDADEYVLSGSYDSLHEFAVRMTSKYDNDWAAMFIRNDWYRDTQASQHATSSGQSSQNSSKCLDDLRTRNTPVVETSDCVCKPESTFDMDKSALRCSRELCERIFPKGTRYSGIIHEQPTKHSICVQAPVIADHDGYLHDGLGKGERNLQYLLQALENDPEDSYLQYQTAITLRNLKRLSESLPYFEKFFAAVTELLSNDPQMELGAEASNSPDQNNNSQSNAGQIKNDLTNSGRVDDSQNNAAKPSLPVYIFDGILRYLYTLMEIGTDATLNRAEKIIGLTSDLFADSTDFYFFCGNFYTKYILQDLEHRSSRLPMIEQCYQACLAIGEQPDRAGVAGTGSFLAAYNLGIWYELNKQNEKAREFYSLAAKYGYEPAKERMNGLSHK